MVLSATIIIKNLSSSLVVCGLLAAIFETVVLCYYDVAMEAQLLMHLSVVAAPNLLTSSFWLCCMVIRRRRCNITCASHFINRRAVTPAPMPIRPDSHGRLHRTLEVRAYSRDRKFKRWGRWCTGQYQTRFETQ